ncbi:MAG TPA: hypothetical protein VFP47_05700, partial [Pyrinomonadaceae bacterium]|nr:hypothetical protein [Pyrinomonadaceae bacterium]
TLKHYFNREQFFPRPVEIVVEKAPALPVWALTGRNRGTGTVRVRRMAPDANAYGSVTWALIELKPSLHGFTDEHFCRD